MPEEREISLVIGTAGHIDHGKTTLVGALTGIDCDRLLEEKKRGITIELGFAPLHLDDGRVVSLVDVPGHERFIRQMVAGASGVDAVILIVAADESVMPQTREHLAILELLGIKEGLIAITKADRVEPEMLELVEEDVHNFVKGTFLEGQPIVSVSSVTGMNMEVLKKELTALVDRVRPRARKGAFFLPIDRAFPIAGFGTVITGTAYRGTARSGEEVEIFPSQKAARIRSLQVHGKPVSEAYAGQRVAVNLSNIAVDELERGDVVCCKGVYANTRCFDAMLTVLPSASEPIKHWQRVRVYIGTSDVLARVSLMESKYIDPGKEAPAQLVLEEDIVCSADQRFIVRFYSPLITIGGGRVVFPYGHKPRGAIARKLASERISKLGAASSIDERFRFLVAQSGVMEFDRACMFIQETSGGVESVAAREVKHGNIVEIRGEKHVYLSLSYLDTLISEIKEALSVYHKSYASEAGMPLEELTRGVLKRLDFKAARSLAALLETRREIVLEENKIRLPDFTPQNDEAFRQITEALFSFCCSKGFQPPTLEEARQELKLEPRPFTLLIQSLKNAKRLFILSGEYLLTEEVQNKTLAVLKKIPGDITLAAVRDATGSSRKFILPILEYFDSKGYTRRVGDMRVLRKSE